MDYMLEEETTEDQCPYCWGTDLLIVLTIGLADYYEPGGTNVWECQECFHRWQEDF